MKKIIPLTIMTLLLGTVATQALSRRIGRDIEFAKGYDEQKAESLRKFVKNERFKFVDGHVSYWPPEIATRLSFEGETKDLNEFFAELRKLSGLTMRLVLYQGRSEELRNDSSWQFHYSQARPDEVVVYLNLNSKSIDFGKLELPEWPRLAGENRKE